MIKTITLEPNIEYDLIVNQPHAIVTNRGDDTLYGSAMPNITIGGDEVKQIDSGTADIIRYVGNNIGIAGHLYLLCASECIVQVETTDIPNFRLVQKGGGGINLLADISIDAITEDFNIQNLIIIEEE